MEDRRAESSDSLAETESGEASVWVAHSPVEQTLSAETENEAELELSASVVVEVSHPLISPPGSHLASSP